jgi:hypothetical protein
MVSERPTAAIKALFVWIIFNLSLSSAIHTQNQIIGSTLQRNLGKHLGKHAPCRIGTFGLYLRGGSENEATNSSSVEDEKPTTLIQRLKENKSVNPWDNIAIDLILFVLLALIRNKCYFFLGRITAVYSSGF